ncbi:hypothetical protein F442_14162, partial [Phytophthora nicotianae P10297]
QDDRNFAELDKNEMVAIAQNEGNMAAIRKNGWMFGKCYM